MKRLSSLLLFAALLILSGCSSDGSQPDPLDYRAQCRVQTTADGQVWECWLVEASLPTVTPSDTPSATFEPMITPAPTTTPRPSATATATQTVTPSNTLTPSPTIDPTPTQEVTGCTGTVTATALNVRATPGGTILKAIPQNTVLTIAARDGTWYRYSDGWVSGQWLALAGECAFPAARVPAFGVHITPGGNVGEMIAMFQILLARGIQPVVKAVSDTSAITQAEAVGAVTIFRSIRPSDCPDMSNPNPVEAARVYAAELNRYYTVRADMYEVSNECSWGDNLNWTAVWGLEMIRQADKYGWGRIILPTWNPGKPELSDLPPLLPLFQALDRRGSCVGMHSYGIIPGVWVSNSGPYLGFRYRMIHDELTRLDPALADLCFALTEVAAGSGNDPVSIGDVVKFWNEAEKDPYLCCIAWWTLGRLNGWEQADLNGYLINIARAVAQSGG